MTPELVCSLQSLLEATHCDEGEESTIPCSEWTKRAKDCVELCSKLLDTRSTSQQSNTLPISLFLFIGGVCGNQLSSAKLTSTSSTLSKAISSLLDILRDYYACKTVRELLLLPANPRTPSDSQTVATQLLRLCIAQVARVPSTATGVDGEPLHTRPFHRDTLLWLADQLDYPELSGEEFLGVLQPLGLRLTEDYRPCMQLAGLRLLRQMSHKARRADWRERNRAEAVVAQLFNRRMTSGGSGTSEDVVHAVWETMLELIKLMPRDGAYPWYDRLADRLLVDLSMESKRSRQTVLLRHLRCLIDRLGAQFAAHSRRFVRVIECVLLGPRTPSYLAASLPEESKDETACALMLHCVQQFIHSAWPLVASALIPQLLAPLVAFVDLEHSRGAMRNDGQDVLASLADTCSNELKTVLAALIQLQPKLLPNVLQPACSTTPALREFLPVG